MLTRQPPPASSIWITITQNTIHAYIFKNEERDNTQADLSQIIESCNDERPEVSLPGCSNFKQQQNRTNKTSGAYSSRFCSCRCLPDHHISTYPHHTLQDKTVVAYVPRQHANISPQDNINNIDSPATLPKIHRPQLDILSPLISATVATTPTTT